jgi:mono/diheme cytochrome c family protein/glucose/arabinose dehydrogenase
MRTTTIEVLCLMAGLEIGATALIAGYRVEDVALPAESLSSEIMSVTFSPEGNLYVGNRLGEIWKADRHGRNWTRFASGLHEPLGLLVESSKVAYVMHRPELTRLEDTDGDGVVDRFDTIADDWGITGNYHEFGYGLRRDKDGNFVGALGLSSGGEKEHDIIALARGVMEKEPVRQERQWSVVPYRGWSFKVSPDEKFIPWAYGFRQPVGIGVDPEGEFFTVDTQGDWVATSGLIHQRKGSFYGHPAALKWLPGGTPEIESDEALGASRTPFSVMLPHGAVGVSPGEPVWDLTGGKFGPFGGQVFIGDFSKLVIRVCLEKVAGEFQGAAFPFFRSSSLRVGNMRMAFSPDGVLYIGQASWGNGQGLQRVVWDGELPVEIQAVQIRPAGFRLQFTVPMNREAAVKPDNYRVRRFRYLYHEKYGSPRIDQVAVEVTRADVSSDGHQVDLVLAEMKPGFVYEFQLEDLPAENGKLLGSPTAFYTANRLFDGQRFTGPFTRALMPAKTPDDLLDVDTEAGKRVYQTYCMPCHMVDGRGGGVAADFTDRDQDRLAKSDAELMRSVKLGVEGEKVVMPPFGAVLSEHEIRNVLAYIRAAFDPLRARGR